MTDPAAGPDHPQAAQPAPASASPNVHRLDHEGRQIYVVGTAHISARSAVEVERLIRELRPQAVCVELCETRRTALAEPGRWLDTDLFQVIRRKQATLLLLHLVLAAFQRRLGEQLGARPGMEMVRAMEAGKAVGAGIVLADRDIRVTLIRTWRSLRWWERVRLVGSLLLTIVAVPRLSEADIEALKQQDLLGQVMATFAQAFPRAKAVLIDERDRFLAHAIAAASGPVVVAVVGAGHLAGILERLKRGDPDFDPQPLLALPPRSLPSRLLQWAVPLAVVALVALGFRHAGPTSGWGMVQVWVVAHAVLAALGAAAAFGHPLTVLTAAVVAPFTALNPMIAAGWLAGLCEVLLRKPRVADFDRLPRDIATPGGFWRNGVSRVLLVVALTNLGSTLGTVIGLPLMGALLGR
ncbi:MAG: TraB/GumN family protein [Candidatus Lambdaproteobacteria bacterium]|nr:TraB/GumN family protein [Candidatus Lambdaproteobacteria bacterium]